MVCQSQPWPWCSLGCYVTKETSLLVVNNAGKMTSVTLTLTFCLYPGHTVKEVSVTVSTVVESEIKILYYRPQTKLLEDNVFAHVCHSVHRGVCLFTAWITGHMTRESLSPGEGSGRFRGGARGAPPGHPNSFDFMQFSGNFGKIVCWRPPPFPGKSWICRWRGSISWGVCFLGRGILILGEGQGSTGIR